MPACLSATLAIRGRGKPHSAGPEVPLSLGCGRIGLQDFIPDLDRWSDRSVTQQRPYPPFPNTRSSPCYVQLALRLTLPGTRPYQKSAYLPSFHRSTSVNGVRLKTYVLLLNGTSALTFFTSSRSIVAVAISGSSPCSPPKLATTLPHGSTIMLCP